VGVDRPTNRLVGDRWVEAPPVQLALDGVGVFTDLQHRQREGSGTVLHLSDGRPFDSWLGPRAGQPSGVLDLEGLRESLDLHPRERGQPAPDPEGGRTVHPGGAEPAAALDRPQHG
jgi:hypothetical protein